MTDTDTLTRIDEMIRARGADYQQLVEFRRERNRTRKREAREQQTPDQRLREEERERNRSRAKLRPFMAVDGEGAGTDHRGRQNYVLMVAAGTTGELDSRHRDGNALSTIDCLEFLLSLPEEPILVGYGFGYDFEPDLTRDRQSPDLAPDTGPAAGQKRPYLYVLGRLCDRLRAAPVFQGCPG